MATNKVPASPDRPAEQTAAEMHADVRMQELEVALAQKAREHDAARDQLLRLMADFDNYRKHIMEQFEQIKQDAAINLVRELLPGLDHLERGLHAARQDATPSSLAIAEGVSLILRQFEEILAKVGVRAIEVQGQPFDPARHEAVGVAAVPPSEDGRIVEEIQRGYTMNDRLLRPAKVIVGKADPGACGG